MHDLDPKFWPLDMRDSFRAKATFGTGTTTTTSTSTGSTAHTIAGTSSSTWYW